MKHKQISLLICFKLVLTRLSDIADVIIDINIRCASDVWKCLLKLSLESYTLCRYSPSATEWIDHAVRVLCSHITSDLMILQHVRDLSAVFSDALFCFKYFINFTGNQRFQTNAQNRCISCQGSSSIGQRVRRKILSGISILLERVFGNH